MAFSKILKIDSSKSAPGHRAADYAPMSAGIYWDDNTNTLVVNPDGTPHYFVTLDTAQTITGTKTFTQEITTLELFADGTVSAPAVAFASDTNSGLYRIGTDNLGVGVAGAKVLDISATGVVVTGNVSVSNAAGPVVLDEAATATNPTLCPDKAETDTGIGWASDTLHFVLGGATEASLTTTAFAPGANAGNALGTTALGWNGLHLATTTAINWANGNVTLTHGSGTLSLVGAIVTTDSGVVLTKAATEGLRIGDWVGAGATGSAVPFSAAQNIYSDGQLDILGVYGESSSNLTSAYSAKCGRFRHLINAAGTVAQETYGVIGQVVTKNSTLSHLHAGVMGTFEGNTTASTLSSSYGVGHAAMIARIGGHAIITATTPLAGFLAFNNASAALTSGISTAFAASMASATYPWSVGVYLPRGAVNQGIRIGHWAGSAALGNAIVFSTATDSADASQLDLVAVYGESAADLTSGISAKCGRFRHVVNGITANHETYGLIGQVVAKNVTYGHLHAGLMGTFEVNTAATVNGAYPYGVAAVIGRLGVGTSITTATKPISAICAVYNGGALVSGDSVAFSATSTTATTFSHFLAADKCDNFFYAATGTAYESGVKIASITSLGAGASGVLRCKVGSVLYYIPLYAAGDLAGE